MTTGEKIILKAERRDLHGKKVKRIRQQGLIPAVLYGKGKENQSLFLDDIQFSKTFAEVGETGLIYINVNSQEIPCIIRDRQIDSIKRTNIHADLMAVNLAEKIEADIPLSFIGEAPTVTEQDGTLIEVKNQVHVEALPQDLVPEIEVDISKLVTFEDTLHIKDIITPKGIAILDDLEETIAIVEPPKTEEELEAELAEPVSEEEAVAAVESETQEGTKEASAEEGANKEE